MTAYEYDKTVHLQGGISIDIYKIKNARKYRVRHHRTCIGEFYNRDDAYQLAFKAVSTKTFGTKFQGEFFDNMGVFIKKKPPERIRGKKTITG